MKTKYDLTGQIFNRLTVLSRDLSKKNKGVSYWNCKCICGKEKSIDRASLIKGNTKSCGCLRIDANVKNAKKQTGILKQVKEDLSGKKFGKLNVIKRDESKIGLERGSFWICKCDCGKEKSISRHSLVNHGTESCGCLVIEKARSKAMLNAQSDRNAWLSKYKRRARDLKIEFSLTDKEFYDICNMECNYCGEKPSKKSRGYKNSRDDVFLANGIDRVDPEIGYILSNCVPCCKSCNFMKTNKKQQIFIQKIFKIADYLRRKNGT